MLQSIASLRLPDTTTSQLRENGFFYVEDLRDVSGSTTTCSLAIQEAQIACKLPVSLTALDVLKEELQQYKISTLSRELNKILDGGFQSKTITELCGAPGSGKTQICLQTSVSVQLSRKHNGLKGEVFYIDTRSGVSTLRLRVRGNSDNISEYLIFLQDFFNLITQKHLDASLLIIFLKYSNCVQETASELTNTYLFNFGVYIFHNKHYIKVRSLTAIMTMIRVDAR